MSRPLPAEAHAATTWVFDVDATLLDGMSATSLRPGATALLDALRDRGCRLVVWSAGGDDYARRRLTETGVIDYFEAVHDKGDRGADRCYDVDAVVDDLRTSVFVDDQPVDLPARATVLAVRPYLSANAHDRELHHLRSELAGGGGSAASSRSS